jgi:hypothetical protein
MAHFAELDAQNKVTCVIVVSNSILYDPQTNSEVEQLGIDFCKSLYGGDTVWRQTSYSGSFRKQFAGIDFVFDPIADVFIAPQPYPSWTLSPHTFDWVPPVPKPDYEPCYWDEDTLSWVLTPQLS